jgi:hypothetical protein
MNTQLDTKQDEFELPKFLDRKDELKALPPTDELPFDLDDEEEVFVQTEEDVGPTVH